MIQVTVKSQMNKTAQVSQVELTREIEPRASLDDTARLDTYHGTLAQQELTYTDIS